MFKTSDIVIAAYLRIEGVELTTIEKVHNKGTFVFKDVPEELITKFDLGQATVEPMTFHNMIKHLTTSVRRICG